MQATNRNKYTNPGMKRYNFLIKPAFFIVNLFVATWLVLKIEKIEPSDFGKHSSIFEPASVPRVVSQKDKVYLHSLAREYKYGIIDSAGLDSSLSAFLAPTAYQH